MPGFPNGSSFSLSLSLSFVFVRGASALRPNSGGGGGGIYSRQLVGYSASADVCGEFYSWHLGNFRLEPCSA